MPTTPCAAGTPTACRFKARGWRKRMPPLAHSALVTAIVLSTLGAVVICLLTVLYGFTPESGTSSRRAPHRTLVTRVGHAVAAACFAGTAILLAVVVARPARPGAPASD